MSKIEDKRTFKISIIVPVYNAEKTIRRCLDSIVAQSFRDFEVILVDDGSPDNSGAICDEYAKKDKRFRVIHKENGGVASARQVGIYNAHGEYTIHCDPDDWVEPDWLEALYNKAIETGADMTICDFYTQCIGGGKRAVQEPTSLNDNADTICDLLLGRIHGSTWNKLIKLSVYKKYGLSFPLNMSYCEDLYVVANALCHKEIRLAYCHKPLYNYSRVNNTSLSQRLKRPQIDSYIFFLQSLSKECRNEKVSLALMDRKRLCKEMMWTAQEYSAREIKVQFNVINRSIIRNGIKALLHGRVPTSCGVFLTLCHLHWLAVYLHRLYLWRCNRSSRMT